MNLSTSPVLIIAEAGVNHNGSLDLAMQLIDIAADSGADVIKFQTFRSNELVSPVAPKADYQLLTTNAVESQQDMLRRLELSESDHEAMIAHAKKRGIAFLSTPFDLPSLILLVDRFGMEVIKIPSGEITNGPFLLQAARTGRKIILSTGMATLADVEAALGVIAYGYCFNQTASEPITEDFERAYASAEGQYALKERVSLLHCTTEYPAPIPEVNLCAMDVLAGAFGLPVGFSDHTPGIHMPIAAVARGARIIEKHFTLDRKMPGPDHAASLEPDELAAMVRNIRDTEMALGDGIKRPANSEWKNRPVARKSLVALRPIKSGELLTAENMGAKRAGAGLSPMTYWSLLGKPVTRDFESDEPINF